jgi:hypothetical protein
LEIVREDIKWVAGLYEGEGFCTSQKGRVIVGMNMTDVLPLLKVANVTGLGKIYGPYDRAKYNKTQVIQNRKPMYEYKVWTYEHTRAFLYMIFQWLSPRRQDQICYALGKEYIYEYDYEEFL